MVTPIFRGALLHLRIALPLLILCVFATPVDAKNTQESLSLNQAISRTLAENPQLHQFSVKKEGLLGQRTSSDFSPPIHVGIGIENVGGSGELSGINAMETTLALSSVIELGSKRNARISVAEARINALEYHKQAFTLDVLGELTAVFVETLELQELADLAKEARDLAQKTRSIVQRRSKKGAAPESEIQRATASLAQAQLQLDTLLQQHERNRIKLASYWGETSPQWHQLEGTLYSFGPQPDFSVLYQRALSSPAIEVFASESRLKTAELQLAKTQSKVDISWQVGVRRFEETGNSAFTAGMSIPLFSDKRNKGTVVAAMAERNEVEYKRQAALLRLHTQLFDAYSQRHQHIDAIKVYQNTVLPELSAALTSTQRAYENGRYSYQDWIAAQQALLRAKQALIESAASAALNQVLIEKLTGEQLTAEQFTSEQYIR